MRLLPVLISLGLLLPMMAFTQSAKDYGFIAHTLTTPELGTVHFYVSDTLHTSKKPLLVYLDGSGDNPLAYFKKDSSGKLLKYAGVPLNLKALSLKYHVLLIGKPNIPFAKEMSDQPTYTFDSVYNRYLSCDWRVQGASMAIDEVCKQYLVDAKKIIVMGYSEGGAVAPQLAVKNKKITHCIAIAGGGLNQFFDQVIKYRMMAYKGEISATAAQQNIDSLYRQFEDIYANPTSTNRFWFGHTYKRWSSFTEQPVMESIKALTIPVLVIQCTNDDNVNVLGADYLRLELLRLHKTNVHFKYYPGMDHLFRNKQTGEDVLFDAMQEAIDWVE